MHYSHKNLINKYTNANDHIQAKDEINKRRKGKLQREAVKKQPIGYKGKEHRKQTPEKVTASIHRKIISKTQPTIPSNPRTNSHHTVQPLSKPEKTAPRHQHPQATHQKNVNLPYSILELDLKALSAVLYVLVQTPLELLQTRRIHNSLRQVVPTRHNSIREEMLSHRHTRSEVVPAC